MSEDIVLSVPWRWVPSPNHGAERTRTLGVFIHGTRGGTANLETDYQATVNYASHANPRDVGPTWVVGPSQVTRMIQDRYVSWCQTIDNDDFLSVEVAQPRDGFPYVEFQYRAAAEICARYSIKYGFPAVHLGRQTTPTVERPGIIGHDESYAGYSRGKTDPGHMWDWTHFMSLVQAKVRELTTPVQTIPQAVTDYAKAHDLGTVRVGTGLSYTDEVQDGVYKTTSGAWICVRHFDPPGDATVQIEHVDWRPDVPTVVERIVYPDAAAVRSIVGRIRASADELEALPGVQ